MFLLGLLAFFQSVFIPGFILLKLKPGWAPGSKVGRAVYGFGLSLLVNYLLVFGLTAVGLYIPAVLYMIITLEILVLVYIYKEQSRNRGYLEFDIPGYTGALKRFTGARPLVYNILLVVAFGVILVYGFYFFYFLGTVFEHWDPVTGWNRFAVDWAANHLPVDTWRYPQLIPCNWSISYVMMQNPGVQSFARAIMPLFALANLLLFLDLAIQKRKSIYLLGLIFYGGLLGYLYGPSYIVSGYMDIPVSFFGFLAFHAWHSREDINGSLGAMIFACAAGVTKQAGLFILIILLIWVIARLITWKKKGIVSGSQVRKYLVIIFFLVLVITGGWYILKEVQIHQGLDRSEVEMVQQAHGIAPLGERVEMAFQGLLVHRHRVLQPLVLGMFFLMLLGLFHSGSRGPALFIMLPFTVIWALFFSYDLRNLALGVPFMAFSAGCGAEVLKKFLVRLGQRVKIKIPVIWALVFLLMGLIVLNFMVFKPGVIVKHQELKKMKVGDAGLNDLLYDYHKKKGLTGKIATNYLYLKFLPGLQDYYFYRPGRLNMEFLDVLDSLAGRDIHFLLTPIVQKRETEVYKRFWDKIKNKSFQLIFKWKGYHFIKIVRE